MIEKPLTTYGKKLNLCDGAVSVDGCNSQEEADYKVKDFASTYGYKPPPKWRFWDQKTWVRK